MGLAGASAKFPCVYCLGSGLDESAMRRSLSQVRNDYQSYTSDPEALRQGRHLEYNSVKESPLVVHDDPSAQIIEYMIPSYLHILLAVGKIHYGFYEVLCQSIDAVLAGETDFLRWGEIRVEGMMNEVLTKTMKELKIIKTQYHGGSLEGNHCRRLFKDDALRHLTVELRRAINSSTLDAEDKEAVYPFLQYIYVVSTKFRLVHEQLSRCEAVRATHHSTVRAKIEEYIIKLQESSNYLVEPPNITPKLHVLKVHVPEFLKIVPLYFGLIDENGNEALHKDNKSIYEHICRPMQRNKMSKLLERALLRSLLRR